MSFKNNSYLKDKDFWDERVQKYGDKACGHLTSYQKCIEILKKFSLSNEIHLEPNQKVLDVGCGNGYWCRWFGKRNVEVTGIDISSKMIDVARRLTPSTNEESRIAFQNVAIEDANFPDESFDLIVSLTTLQHITDDERCISAVKNIIRMLKPKGCIVIIEYSPKQKTRNFET